MADVPDRSTTPSPVLFSYTISEKLSNTIFLIWKQQIEPIIKAHRLHRFVVNPNIPPEYTSLSNCDQGKENPDYTLWETQDQLLLSWLQSSLLASFLLRVLGCKHSFQIWEKIHSHFHTQTKAKARQLHPKLRNMKKRDRSIIEFLLRLQTIVHSL